MFGDEIMSPEGEVSAFLTEMTRLVAEIVVSITEMAAVINEVVICAAEWRFSF